MVGLEPVAPGAELALPQGVHSSAAAALAWRHAQLLSALPKRDTEAAAWAHTAHKLFEAAPNGFEDEVEEAFGGLQACPNGLLRTSGPFL